MTVCRSVRRLAGPFTPGLRVRARLFAVSHDARLVFSGGHWDNSVRVWSVTRNRKQQSITAHHDVVTCVSLDTCGKHLMTGSRDTTCMIWEVSYDKYGQSVSVEPRPLHVLYGHESEVTTAAISSELDMAVSGSMDGTVVVHSVRQGSYMRTVRPPHEKGWRLAVHLLAVSEMGHIAVYCHHTTPHNNTATATVTASSAQERMTLHLYSINGKHLSMETVYVPVSDLLLTADHLVFANVQGVLIVKELFGLRTLTSLPLHVPITCVSVTNSNSHFLVGLSDGNLIIVGIKRQPEAK